jgi:hypothetical protein
MKETSMQYKTSFVRRTPAHAAVAAFVLSAVLMAGTAGAQDINDGLLVEYLLDETSGLVAADTSGNGRHGELISFPDQDSHWIEGYKDGALSLMESSGYVAVSGLPMISNTTWSAWVRPGVTNSNQSIITATFPGAGAGHLLQLVNGVDGPAHAQVYWNHDQAAINFRSPQSLELGKWHHVAMTIDAGTGLLSLYVDGVLVNTGTGVPKPYEDVVYIGRRIVTGTGFPMSGAVDEVRIYDRALSAQEIREISGFTDPQPPGIVRHPLSQTVYAGSSVTFSVLATGDEPLSYQWYKDDVLLPDAMNTTLMIESVSLEDAGPYHVIVTNEIGQTSSNPAVLIVQEGATGLLVEYLFEEKTGLVATDTSGHGRHGELRSFPDQNSHWIQGIKGGGLSLMDSSGYVAVTALPMISNTTWSAWVRPGATNSNQSIITATFPGAGAGHVLQLVNGTNGPVHAQVIWNHNLAAINFRSPRSLELGKWHHVAATVDAGAGLLRLYVDGELVNTATGVPKPYENVVQVGRRVVTGAGSPIFGAVDEVRIYDVVLSAQEIRALAKLPMRLAVASIRSSAPNQLELSIDTSAPGRTHRVQFKTHLDQPQWQEQDGVVFEMGADNLLRAVFNVSTEPTQFFRIVMEEPQPIYFEDFESGAPGWTHGGAGDNWELGTPTTGPGGAFSGEKVFATGLHSMTLADADAFLRSPVIDLTGRAEAVLSFMEFLRIDPNPDYHRTVVRTLDPNSLEVLEVLGTKAGVVPVWTERRLPLGAASLGRPIILEFRIITDSAFLDAGWYIDDVTVHPE